MSEITGKSFSEPFKMRVVSGMLVGGAIQVSWATGEKASSQMDWGFDASVPYQTPEYHHQPRTMVRYHTLPFPQTLMDTEHFFRVRSVTASGKTGVSPVYSVIVPKELRTFVDGALVTTGLALPIQLAKTHLVVSNYPTSSAMRLSSEPEAVGSSSISHQVGVPQQLSQSISHRSLNLSTNNIITIT